MLRHHALGRGVEPPWEPRGAGPSRWGVAKGRGRAARGRGCGGAGRRRAAARVCGSPRRSVPGACSGEAQPGASVRTDLWTDGRTDSEGRWQRSRPLSGGTRREPGSPRAPRRLRVPGTGRGGRVSGRERGLLLRGHPGSPASPLSSPAPTRRGRSRPRRWRLTWAQRGPGAASGTQVERAGRGHHEQRRQHHLCQPQAAQAGAENVSVGGPGRSAGAGGLHAGCQPGTGSGPCI